MEDEDLEERFTQITNEFIGFFNKDHRTLMLDLGRIQNCLMKTEKCF